MSTNLQTRSYTFFIYYRNSAKRVSRNSSIQENSDALSNSDISGDLGDYSITSECSSSMISTLISQNSKEFGNISNHEEDGEELLENIDLALSFEEMSDAFTTTASSFTMASSIESGSIKTMKMNQDIYVNEGRPDGGFGEKLRYKDTTNSNTSASSIRHCRNVCIANNIMIKNHIFFHSMLFISNSNFGYQKPVLCILYAIHYTSSPFPFEMFLVGRLHFRPSHDILE